MLIQESGMMEDQEEGNGSLKRQIMEDWEGG